MSLDLKPYRRVKDLDEKTAELQNAMADSLGDLQKPILAGQFLEVSFSGASVVRVNHGLQRFIQGWVVVDRDANVGIWRPNKDSPALFLNLESDGAVNIKIWVF